MESIKLRIKMTVASIVFAGTLIGIPLSAYAGFAPSARPTFQCITPTNCPGPEYVAFNSFTNAPNYGDERAFFDGKDAGITGPGGYQDKLSVHDGQKLVLRAYIHNNADPKVIGDAAATAKNTKMQVILPTSKKKSNTAAAQISADNANPGTVSDTVDMSAANDFTMKFDKSAPVQVTYRPNGTGAFVTRTLPSASFSNDHTLNANFGDWKGCFEFAALVTMTVMVEEEIPPPPEVPPEQPPEKPEKPEKPAPPRPAGKLPEAGPAGVIATFIGVSSLGSILHYVIIRRFF